MVVNLASNCGFTGQYADLETLYQMHQDKLVILGFPANDFGGQEPGSNEVIAAFCTQNFNVTFPLFTKDSVKGETMQPVYQWLTNPAQNGWNSEAPGWNFCKYLLSPEGELLGFFSSAVSPLSGEIINQLI
jgi:glutathione peroxidase